jgi:hypothetical protein
VEERAVAAWLDGYSHAWGTYDPEEIGALFSADAVYWYDPFTEPLRGREAIVADWLKDRDEYDNLFLLRFDAEGRCAEYREWYMRKPKPRDG